MDDNQVQDKIIALQNELEEKNQQIHDYKRQLATAQALEQDYLQEIEVLQVGDKVEAKKLNAKIQQLEDQLVNLNEHVKFIELEIVKKDKCITDLHGELKQIESAESKENATKEHECLMEENAKLKQETLCLSTCLGNNQNALEKLQQQNNELEETVTSSNAELNQIKEILSCTKDELREANGLIQTQQEDLVVLKSELDSLKGKPLDEASKGNSLFAEVNDSRLQTQNNMRQMKNKYVAMKQEFAVKQKAVTELRGQNLKLAKLLEEEVDLHQHEINSRVDIYTNHISNLERLLEDFKNEAAGKADTVPNHTMDFLQNMLQKKNNELKKLRNDFEMESRAKMVTSLQLKDVELELRKWRAQSEQLKLRVDELEEKLRNVYIEQKPEVEEKAETSGFRLSSFRLSSNVSTRKTSSFGTSSKSCKSILKTKNENEENIPDVPNAEENQIDENVVKDRKVGFSECTKLTETNNARLKRGGKVVECKAIRISSNPKN